VLSLSVKEFCKLVHIWWSLGQMSCVIVAFNDSVYSIKSTEWIKNTLQSWSPHCGWLHFLLRSKNLPNGLYILLALISSFFFFIFFSMSRAISVSTGPISRSFHQMEGVYVNFLDPVQFFRFLKGRCHGNQFSSKNGAKVPTPCTYRSANPKLNGTSWPQCALITRTLRSWCLYTV